MYYPAKNVIFILFIRNVFWTKQIIFVMIAWMYVDLLVKCIV